MPCSQENEQLKTKSDQSHNALIESAKKQVQSELAFATQQYKKAYESGDTESIVTAQQALNTAQIRADKVDGLKPKTIQQSKEALQPQENNVQSQAPIPEGQVVRDEKAEAWRQNNAWFGKNHEMTAWALGMHRTLENEGINTQSDEYYERINSRARQLFPEEFEGKTNAEPEAAPQQKPSNVVAPATRSISPNKVKLTKSQLAVAKRLNVPPTRYAEQALKLAREQNG